MGYLSIYQQALRANATIANTAVASAIASQCGASFASEYRSSSMVLLTICPKAPRRQAFQWCLNRQLRHRLLLVVLQLPNLPEPLPPGLHILQYTL